MESAYFVRTLEGNKIDGCFDGKIIGSAVAWDDEKNGSAIGGSLEGNKMGRVLLSASLSVWKLVLTRMAHNSM